jgi:hypothetical protein
MSDAMDRLLDALASCIVGYQGKPNRERARLVLAEIEAQEWRLVPLHAMAEAWRPIDSAPKDGTTLLVFIPRKIIPTGKRHADGNPFTKVKDARCMIARWADGPEDTAAKTAGLRAKGLAALKGGYWTARSDALRPIHAMPTHWMPLPDPPEEDK